MSAVDDPNEPESKKTHPDFTITCDECGSQDVAVLISVGFSAESGSWGSVDLECQACNNSTDIWSPH